MFTIWVPFTSVLVKGTRLSRDTVILQWHCSKASAAL